MSLLVVALLAGFFVDADRPSTVEPMAWWHWALIATPSILVAFRRTAPIPVTVLASIAQAGIWVNDLPEVLLPIIVILYSAASEAGERGLRVSIAASVGLTIVTGFGVRIADDVTLYQLPLIALTCGTAIALGVNAARQRRLSGDLAAEVAETRLRSEHERAQSVADERSHIARELHDIIGHTLSVIAVRAEAADRVAQRRPEAAAEAVSEIADASRSALTETRRVLDGLRRYSAEAELTPPPDIAATRRLVSDLVEAGVTASLTEQGCELHIPPAVVSGGAHRIVQESLTNAIKHSGSDVVIDVQLTCHPGELEIVVTNSVTEASANADPDPAGAGLVGMAERAGVLGGTFDAGRVGEQFVVRATLPTHPATSPKAQL